MGHQVDDEAGTGEGGHHAGHGHRPGHGGHGHGHHNDRGLAAVRRYLKQAPRMWRSELNDAVVARLAPTPGEQALDIGAGMGAGVTVAAATGARVVAVEPTPFLRGILQLRRLASRSRSRISVVDGAAEHLGVADGSVDVAWAVNAMHHWVDRSAAARELARVLRPGGRILLVDEHFTDPEHPDIERHRHRDRGPHRHGFTQVEADAIAALLGDAGLVDVEAGRGVVAGRPGLIVTGRAPLPAVEEGP